MNNQPSILKIIKNDLFAAISAAFPVIAWVLYLALWFFKEIPTRSGTPLTFAEDGATIMNYCLILTILGILIVIYRIRAITLYFSSGIECVGTVQNVYFFKGRGKITCTYKIDNTPYTEKTRVNKTKETKALSPGQSVTLLGMKNQPIKFIIKDLFIA